jgi:hypothetical protein
MNPEAIDSDDENQARYVYLNSFSSGVEIEICLIEIYFFQVNQNQ